MTNEREENMARVTQWSVCRYVFAGEEFFDTEDEAKSALAHLELLQPNNHYEIVETAQDKHG